MTENEEGLKERQKKREAEYDEARARAKVDQAIARYELLSSGHWTLKDR